MTLWLLAILPIALLLALVLWGRLSTWLNAAITLTAAVAIALAAFDAPAVTVGVGLLKGSWVGVWILYVVVPALLMHHAATRMGMTALGQSLAKRRGPETETVLLLAWVLPSFLQGVSGFGTPVAVCAPLVAALGVHPVRSVALVLIGYQWSVGFGSMGSSFYMGALTARLNETETHTFAVAGALLLGINALVSGLLVCIMHRGLRGVRGGLPALLTAGPAMVVGQAVAVRFEPGIGALVGGSSGVLAFLVLTWVRKRRALSSDDSLPVLERSGAQSTVRLVDGRASDAVVPYIVLAVTALSVFVPPTVRAFVRENLLLGPSFPPTSTGAGDLNEGVTTYNPIALLGHPGSILLVATGVSLIVWAVRGRLALSLPKNVVIAASKQSLKTGPPVILLAAIAGLLVDSGMVRTIAEGASMMAGAAYPLIAPAVGALGSFITGSTTNSNALFSALQAEVASLLDISPAYLLAGQLAGGNVGNALAPVVILLGLSAVGATREVGGVLRATFPAAIVLLTLTITSTWILTSV